MIERAWRKIANNYGPRAWRVLGRRGYWRYLRATAGALPKILASGDLRPVDRAMCGVLVLRHPMAGRDLRIDLDAYRPGDESEDTYAFGLVREIWLRDIYLRHFALPPRLSTVVDLGANRGVFALQAAAMSERVLAVEPLLAYQSPLQHNLDLNGLHNVEMLAGMVGGRGALDDAGTVPLDLQDVLERVDGPVDLLKVDIEGSEFGLDLDALYCVRRLAMEMHADWGDRAALVARVVAAGFECRTYDDGLRPATPASADFLIGINKRHSDVRWAP